MLSLFRRKSAVENFISGLSVKQKKAIMLSLLAIYRANKNYYADKVPLKYIDFYGQLLHINRRKIVLPETTREIIKPLNTCTELEKAVIVLILRGLTNVDHEATKTEADAIYYISQELGFEFNRFLEQPQHACDPEKMLMIFKEIILPDGNDSIEGGKMISNFSKIKLTTAEAEALYVSIAMNYELTPITNIAAMQQELKQLGLCIDYENSLLLYDHLKGRFMKRLEHSCACSKVH